MSVGIPSPLPACLKLSEVAMEARVTKRTVAQWIADQRLASVKIGGARRVLRTEFERFLRSNEQVAIDFPPPALTGSFLDRSLIELIIGPVLFAQLVEQNRIRIIGERVLRRDIQEIFAVANKRGGS